MIDSYELQPIGVVHSPCREKFAVPRQPGLVPALVAQIEILPEFAREEAFAQLDGFSHIWLVSLFHQVQRATWQPTVRPPRLGGNKRVGVFASRSPFRPNPIGLSLVVLQRMEIQADRLILHVQGCDLVDGTPIVDIKPYLPYADSRPDAIAGYVQNLPVKQLQVSFSEDAQRQCALYERQGYNQLSKLIVQLVQQDPRPAYVEDEPGRSYAFRLYDFDVVFHVDNENAFIDTLRPIRAEKI